MSTYHANEQPEFYEDLHKHLLKCALEYRAEKMPRGSTVSWLTPYCDTPDHIAQFLRSLGFRIKKIVDEPGTFSGDRFQWVVTTNGVIVYANRDGVEGLVAKARYTN